MLNPITLFTSFKGRIGRRSYWFGLIVLIAISPFSVGAILSADPFREAVTTIKNLGLAGLGWSLALLIPLAALNTKRLHDLDQTGLKALLFYAPAALSSITLFTGWQPDMQQQIISYTTLLATFLGATGIWFLLRLGFTGGTDGPNSYGPDPSA
ncbi:MAG: DUF805 domain-containing protein [Hyphomicrobiaceae bacterium]